MMVKIDSEKACQIIYKYLKNELKLNVIGSAEEFQNELDTSKWPVTIQDGQFDGDFSFVAFFNGTLADGGSDV